MHCSDSLFSDDDGEPRSEVTSAERVFVPMNHYLARVDESLSRTCRVSSVYSIKEARKNFPTIVRCLTFVCEHHVSLLYCAKRDYSPLQAFQRRGKRTDGEVEFSTSGARSCATFCQQCGKVVWIFVARSHTQRYGGNIDPQRRQSTG